jgi:hypothetical protein
VRGFVLRKRPFRFCRAVSLAAERLDRNTLTRKRPRTVCRRASKKLNSGFRWDGACRLNAKVAQKWRYQDSLQPPGFTSTRGVKHGFAGRLPDAPVPFRDGLGGRDAWLPSSPVAQADLQALFVRPWA